MKLSDEAAVYRDPKDLISEPDDAVDEAFAHWAEGLPIPVDTYFRLAELGFDPIECEARYCNYFLTGDRHP